MTVPDQKVFTRLQPSTVNGVGVFAVRPIPRGAHLFAGDTSEIVWIEEKRLPKLPPAIRKLYDDFCVRRHGRLGCPKNFNAMTPSWYVNHSDRPNVVIDQNFDFYAARDIRIGEELFVDYRTYSE